MKSKIIVHPVLFAVFPVIMLYFNNIRFVSVSEIVLPLAIVVGITVSIWIVLKLILKDDIKSALITSFVLVICFSYGYAYLMMDGFTINDIDISKHRYLLIPFLTVFIVGVFYLIKTNKKLNSANTITNIGSLTIVVITLVNIGAYNLENSFAIDIEDEPTLGLESIKNTKELPNIYFIILDGYPGYDSLKTTSNYDNSQFINYLEDNGFFIHKESYSNYAHSFISIPSTLNMKYFNYLAEEVGDSRDQTIPYEMGSNNKVMNFLKSQGYTVASFDSGWGFTRDMKSAELQLCGDNQLFNSNFLIMLVKASALNPIYVKIFETSHIELKLCAFDELPKIQNRVTEPVFVFAHILLPHPPYIFAANGEIRSVDSLDLSLEIEDNNNRGAHLEQLKFVNNKMPEVVNQLLDSESPPVIIIASDHGTAFLFNGKLENWDNPTNEMVKERMDNIMFVYLPDNAIDIFYEDMTSVNIFRVLFNHYFETEMEILEDRSFFSKDEYYNFKDVTKMLRTT